MAKYKKMCKSCKRYVHTLISGFGTIKCQNCLTIKSINQLNAISIPSFLVKKYCFTDQVLKLEERPEGILIRLATPEEKAHIKIGGKS